MFLISCGIVVSRAPVNVMILVKIRILLKTIIVERKISMWKACLFSLRIPTPRQVDIMEVTRTKANTAGGFALMFKIRLKIILIIVILPIRISMMAKIVIPNLRFTTDLLFFVIR